MYFANFPKIVYDFDLEKGTDYRFVTDITRNVRFRKQILENISLWDYYEVQEGETPEIISEKVYGTPYYHWVIMLANQRYDYVNDFPLSRAEFEAELKRKYGENRIYHVNHYKENGLMANGINVLKLRESPLDKGGIGEITPGKILQSVDNGYLGHVIQINVPNNGTYVTVAASLRTGKYYDNETLTVLGESTFVEVDHIEVPENYIMVSNHDHENNINESKRRIKIIAPEFVAQVMKEFSDLI